MIPVTVIRPSEGMYLTQANITENEERVFSKEVWLSINDGQENWVEWSEEQKAEYEESQRLAEDERRRNEGMV